MFVGPGELVGDDWREPSKDIVFQGVNQKFFHILIEIS